MYGHLRAYAVHRGEGQWGRNYAELEGRERDGERERWGEEKRREEKGREERRVSRTGKSEKKTV